MHPWVQHRCNRADDAGMMNAHPLIEHPLLDFRPSLRSRLTGPTAPAYGIFLLTGDSGLAEACGLTDLAWMVIDMEAGALSRRDVLHCLQALTGSRCAGLVRVPGHSREEIEHVLDLGAEGVLVPKVDTADDAAAAVRACRFPPDGTRGINPVRASGYFADVPGYLREANHRTLCLVQIESAAAVANACDIAKVPGVDGLFIGMGDLAASLGQPGVTTGPAMDKGRAAVLAAAREHGKVPGLFAYSLDLARQYAAEGFRMIGIGNEVKLLREALVTGLADLPSGAAGGTARTS
jgi:2-keto-3-deoxy-L-rhamnonate aldolase RhmA